MADDIIGALTSRVRELSLRVASLEGELDAAHRRVRVYEGFDHTVQDALSSALRSAFEIRERAELTATAIVDDAKSQRLTRDATHQPAAAAAPTATPATQLPMAELRLAASEALRGVFKELVDEIRSAPQPTRMTAPSAPRIVDPVPPPPAAHLDPFPQTRIEPPLFRQDPPRAGIEDVEEAPVRFLPSEPSSEVQLVLSPIPSFPRLVEIERRIQSLPSVRTLYVRDFRGGVATLAVGLRQPLASSEFAAALGGLEHPRLRVVSSTRNELELRIDGESAIA